MGDITSIPQSEHSSLAQIKPYDSVGLVHDPHVYSGPKVEPMHPGTGIKELDPYITPGGLHLILTDYKSRSHLEEMLTGPQVIHKTNGRNLRNILAYEMLPSHHQGHIILCTDATKITGRIQRSEDYIHNFSQFSLVAHFYWYPDIDSPLSVFKNGNKLHLPTGKNVIVKNEKVHWYDGYLDLLNKLGARLR